MAKRSWSLFSRLLMYFIIIMLIPLSIAMAYYYFAASRAMLSTVKAQSESAIAIDGETIASVLESYRHKAYEISTDELLVSLMEKGSAEPSELTEIYRQLFSVMSGDTYLASANIVSLDGRIRLSTHIFPEEYDLRIQGNEWESGNILTEASTRTGDDRASFIYAGDHRMTDEQMQIFASVLRTVFDEEGQSIGYVIIDIFTEAIIPHMRGSAIFTDEILIDNTYYTAFSLLHPNTYGSFSRFPDLTSDEKLKSSYSFSSFTLTGITDTSAFTAASRSMIVGFAISLLSGFVISIALSFLFSRSLSGRITNMKRTMKYIEEGNLNLYLEETGISDFDQLASSFNSMVTRIIALLQKEAEEQTKLAEAERKALESQLDPHFIFNTLSTIKALARIHGEEDIYTIAVQLGRLLRSSLSNRSPECTIKESLELAESYLKIQKIRFGDKLEYTIRADEEVLPLMTPKLIIQPLVENALIHGIEPTGEKGSILIEAMKSGSHAIIRVTDTGRGADENIFSDLERLNEEGHVGIYNIYRRLKLRYGISFSFRITSSKEDGTAVEIQLPLEGNG